ncbi:MAG: hypothetical protein AB8I08_19300 [Sandaracinaceae bacterium]
MTGTTEKRASMSQNRHSAAATRTRSWWAGPLSALMLLSACGAPGIEAREASVTEPAAQAPLAYETTEAVEDAPQLAALGLAVPAPETAAVETAEVETAEVEPVELETEAALEEAEVVGPPAAPESPERATAFFDHADAPIRRGLSSMDITEVERGRGGRSLGFRVTFEDGSRGYFKPDQAFNGMSWNAEIAAYHLDRELGLGRVAPVVSREIDWSTIEAAATGDGRVGELHVGEDETLTGAMIWWVPERLVPVSLPDGWQRWLRVEGVPARVTPFQRPGAYRVAVADRTLTPMPAAPTPDIEERPGQISDLIVFDYLTNNLDRWGGNNTNIRTVGAGGPVMYLDNAASFTLRRARNSMMDRRLHEVQRFRRSTIDAIRALDVEAYGERINADENGPILEDLHLRNLETRRQHLIEYVDGLVEAHGEEAVYSL